MKDKIKNKVNEILKSNNIYEFEIEYGYDCFWVELLNTDLIFSDMVKSLEDEFDNEIIVIKINEKGNIVFHIDAKCVIKGDD